MSYIRLYTLKLGFIWFNCCPWIFIQEKLLSYWKLVTVHSTIIVISLRHIKEI